ncbi:MAG: hypothetical protein JWP22_967 [Ramlibacter sp.]|jgi:hypothetical protein|nr:hypothetical protein [Ramlibacter sp.]MDB5912292.1 hypothetical protein [Ramlibacter sp.]
MSRVHSAARLLRACFTSALVAGSALLTGCAVHYVDGATKDVPPSAFARRTPAKPVQVLVEFQTKGVSNARATGALKQIITDNVKATGLFSEVRDVPAPDAGVLSVTLNNIPLSDDAFAKGFLAGMTFGAAGQQVTDGYVCTVSYLAPGASKPVVKTARHAIHTTVGASSAPANTYKASSIDDAVRVMVRQVMSTVLFDLSGDAEFK